MPGRPDARSSGCPAVRLPGRPVARPSGCPVVRMLSHPVARPSAAAIGRSVVVSESRSCAARSARPPPCFPARRPPFSPDPRRPGDSKVSRPGRSSARVRDHGGHWPRAVGCSSDRPRACGTTCGTSRGTPAAGWPLGCGPAVVLTVGIRGRGPPERPSGGPPTGRVRGERSRARFVLRAPPPPGRPADVACAGRPVTDGSEVRASRGPGQPEPEAAAGRATGGPSHTSSESLEVRAIAGSGPGVV